MENKNEAGGTYNPRLTTGKTGDWVATHEEAGIANRLKRETTPK